MSDQRDDQRRSQQTALAPVRETRTIRVFGGVAVSIAGEPIDLGGPRQRRLLAALVIERGATVTADRLIDRIWGDGVLPDDPRRALRTYLTRLRHSLGAEGVVLTEPEGWRLDPAEVDVDLDRFEQLIARAREIGLGAHERLVHDRESYRRTEPLAFENVNVGSDVTNDGKYIVVGGADPPRAQIFALESGRAVSQVLDLSEWATDADAYLSSAVFDSQGERLLLSLKSGTTVVFSTATWQVIDRVPPEDFGGVIAARFSRDGSVMVARSATGLITVRDPVTFKVRRTIEGGTGAAEELAPDPPVSATGEWLLTVRESVPRLWHLPTETLIGTFPHERGLVASGKDRGDELRLVTLVGEQALLWNLNTDEWPEIACRAAGRNLTKEEWEQFGPQGEPYRATCEQWPALG